MVDRLARIIVAGMPIRSTPSVPIPTILATTFDFRLSTPLFSFRAPKVPCPRGAKCAPASRGRPTPLALSVRYRNPLTPFPVGGRSNHQTIVPWSNAPYLHTEPATLGRKASCSRHSRGTLIRPFHPIPHAALLHPLLRLTNFTLAPASHSFHELPL